jgi:hypothetical protein
MRVVRTMVMLDPDQCRLAAEKCRREAAQALSPIERERWLKIPDEQGHVCVPPTIIDAKTDALAIATAMQLVDGREIEILE